MRRFYNKGDGTHQFEDASPVALRSCGSEVCQAMTMSGTGSSPRFRAFISYSHQDELWAQWLHKALEAYRVPRKLVGQITAAGIIPDRLAPIFRDRDELPSATDLNRKVNEALGQSANLIVVCSPRSAASRWVDEEVLAFKRLGRANRIFCLIVDGEPNATDLPGRAAEECFAPALRFEIGPDGQPTHQRTEPIAADARAGKDGKGNAKLKLIAGMLDVGFDTLKQRELHRRNRRMAAITALALVIMTITTTLAITAVIARHDAERRQKQAEDLVNFMLGDLNDKLAEVQRLDIMEAVDDHAMKYFESLPTTDVTDEALAQRAKALEKIGAVRMNQGHLPAAMESFQASAKLSAGLVDAMPGDPTRRLAYSRTLAFVGMTHWSQGELDRAQESFESAEKALQHAESTAEDDPKLIFQLTSLDNNIGHVLEARGKLDEAEAQYRRMLSHCEQLVGGKVVKTEWRAQLGAAHNNLGKVALMRGDLATAVAQYSADDAIESELSARDPKDNMQRENVLVVRAILGRTLALTGDIEAGIRDLQQAVATATELTKVDPNQTSSQDYVAIYSSQLARLQRLSGDLSTASALTARALAIFDTLTKQDPENADWQVDFAAARIEQAAQLHVAGHTQASLTAVRAALAILDPLLIKQPDDRTTVLAAVAAKLLLATLTDNAEVAQHLREDALTLVQGARSGNGDPRLLALQVEALLALGRKDEARPVLDQLWTKGYRDHALLALLQRENIDYPANPEFQRRLQAAIGNNDHP
jgi:tetratricopeptide (TPR) repeat protein